MFKKLPIRQCLITSDYRTWKLVNFDKNEFHWLTHIGQQVASKKVLEYANLNAPILSFFLFSKTPWTREFSYDQSLHSNVRFWMCIILDEVFLHLRLICKNLAFEKFRVLCKHAETAYATKKRGVTWNSLIWSFASKKSNDSNNRTPFAAKLWQSVSNRWVAV